MSLNSRVVQVEVSYLLGSIFDDFIRGAETVLNLE
jgi:hypothetical protein